MSSNISGFQGVNTPLQSMTNGGYTLADYTNQNRVFGARITSLEKAVAFNPNNVNIGGFLNIQPNTTQPGNLSVTNNAQISGSMQINKSLTVNQNVNVGGNLQVSGTMTFVNAAINTLNSTTITNTGIITSGTFVGNGAAVTNVNDTSKLPLTGGTLSGNLTLNGGAIISGNGSGLTNINDINKLPLTGGSLTGPLNVAGALIVTGANRQINNSYYNLVDPTTFTTEGTVYTNNSHFYYDNNALNGDHVFAANNGIGTQYTPLIVSSNVVTISAPLTVTNGITGNGAQLTNIPYSALAGTVPTWNQNTTGNAATATTALSGTDNTKLPLAGGIMTGQINAQNILFEVNFQAYNYKRNRYTSFDNFPGVTYTVLQQNGSVHDYVRLEFNNACTVNLAALTITGDTYYQDAQRYVTITKKAVSLGAFAVTVLPPTGYLFYNAAANGSASFSIPNATFSVTFLISNFNGNVVDLVSSV